MTIAYAPHDAWSVLSPEASPDVDITRWMHAARTHFAAELSRFDPDDAHTLRFGVSPARDIGRVTVVRVRSVLVEDAPDVIAAANAGARAIGGAGMDVLVARARRVWQARRVSEPDADARAPLVLAAVWANVMLGPVVSPDEITLFGMRGARVRLEVAGWR